MLPHKVSTNSLSCLGTSIDAHFIMYIVRCICANNCRGQRPYGKRSRLEGGDCWTFFSSERRKYASRIDIPDEAGTLLYIFRVSFNVAKFWTVLKMAMVDTRSIHFGRSPGDWGSTVQCKKVYTWGGVGPRTKRAYIPREYPRWPSVVTSTQPL